ncbi:Kazal-type serine protease inhibitor domain [Popillia japonica]|uniref:Kazal-type serine protease inhibitor domain n=1 Tax=Popillia japonica TaxID=7064 RepID=A0AAW1KI24_POPJA
MKYFFVFTLVLAFIAGSTIANAGCPDRPCEDFGCGGVWDPVCATDGNGIYRTFGNSCEILQYNCRLDTARCFEMVSDGPCPGTSP